MSKKNLHTKFICLIPARHGSKRLKNKNIKLFNSKPLIYWTIKCAQDAGINEIFVFSDCEKIRNLSKRYGANISIRRPRYVSNAKTKMIETVKYFNDRIKDKISFDAVIILQPTSPLRKSEDLKKAMKTYIKKQPETLVSGIELCGKFSPSKFMLLNDNDFLEKSDKFFNKNILLRDGPSILICSNKTINQGKIYGKKTMVFKVNSNTFSDIDTELDFLTAELSAKKKL